MSTIDDLETTFVEAVLSNLIVDVELHKNYMRVYLKHTDNVEVTIRKLTDHIRKNFPQVKYFNIDKQNSMIDIYHYKNFDQEKRQKAIEEKL
jgi:hypothetical protein